MIRLEEHYIKQVLILNDSLQFSILILKSDSNLPKKICIIYLIESPLKLMKNAFYFILKPLFVKFFFMAFGHEAKTARLERSG